MSTFLDDRGRLFGRVNLVDLLVLAVLIALVVFAYLRFSGSGGEQTVIRTTFAVEKIREATFLQFKEGAEVRDDTGTVLGRIERADVTPMMVEVPTATGELKGQPSPVYSDLVIVISGPGHASPGLVRVGSVPLKVGKILVITGPTFEVRAQIRNVEVVS